MSALYRKYRPQDLSEVVGQRPVVRTLTNAIAADRVRHAYLFAGPRGTGKTSLAKILAKSLNCLAFDAPTTTPCRRCASCVSIHDATSLDVLELDAASNRGIDDVREIRERVAVRPVQGRRKVYILDEAHSLTTDASNALLKTLEEPPEHVVFVLCTTEPHRLLDTIKGRCQAFAFTRPTLDELREVVARIAEAEGIEIDEAALDLVTRAGRGSFRDAVSILDQLATACDRRIGLDEARALLGVVDAATLVRLTDLVAARDAAGLLVAVDELVEAGQDLGQLLADLTEHVRNVFLTRQLGGPPRSAPVTADARGDLVRQAQALDERTLVAFADGLVQVQGELREGGDPRLPFELLLVKLTRPSAERSVDAILRRVDALEGGAAFASAAAPAALPEPTPTAAEPPEPQVPESPAAPPAAAPAPVPAPEPVPVAATPPAVPAAPGADLPAVDDRELSRVWEGDVLPRVAEERPPLAAALHRARPVALEGGVLRLAFPSNDAFHKSVADQERNRDALGSVLTGVFGQRLRVRMETIDVQPEPGNGGDAATEPAAPDAVAEPDDPLEREEAFIARLRSEFDATDFDAPEEGS